jgi:hypothetical protein
MRRSASTLQYQLARELTECADDGWIKLGELDAYIAANNTDEMHVLKIHAVLLPNAPVAHGMFPIGKARGLHIYRHPLDAMASLRKFRPKMPFEPDVMAIAKEHRYWSSRPSVRVVRYDDVVNDIASEVRAMAGFLGIAISEQLPAKLAARFSLAEQRKRMPAKGWDQKTTMWNNHINTGKSGIWKDILTPGEIAIVRRHMGSIIHKYEKGQPKS